MPDEPEHGDQLEPMNWIVDYTSQGLVWFVGRSDHVPRENMVMVSTGVWNLVDVDAEHRAE